MPPFDGAGSFSLPAGYLAVTATTIQPTQHNPPLEDIAAALTACVKRSGAGAMTGLLTLSGDPSSALHAATKQYADAQAAAAVAALNIKPSVLCASTGNLTLSAEQTIDGQLTSASRVLVKNQTAPAENGIYLTGSGAWSRVTDMDAWTEVYGAIVKVEKGTTWADTVWLVTADSGGTLNTTAITWRRMDSSIRRRADTTTAITIASDDFGSFVTSSNASAVAVTVPQATGAFGVGFWFIHQNLGAGTATDTPTTSTVNGAASLTVKTNDAYLWVSDGTNWRAIPLGMTVDQINATKWPLGWLSGLNLSRVNATTYGITAGVAANEDGGTQRDMTLSSAFTKTLSAWAVGTGNGSLDTGAVANNTWYHIHLIHKTADSTTDILMSTSATSPTMPGGYTARRRVGSILTNGSAQIVSFVQVGDEFLWDAAVIDVDDDNPGTAAVTRTLSVPTGVKVLALVSVGGYTGSNGFTIVASSLDVSDQAAQVTGTAVLSGFPSNGAVINGAQWSFSTQLIRTNTSAQIRTRVSASGASDRIGVVTRGWVDQRGRN